MPQCIPTALELLLEHIHATPAMHHAAMRYAEMVHSRPIGGPHISRSLYKEYEDRPLFRRERTGSSQREILWQCLETLVKTHALGRAFYQVACNNDYRYLPLFQEEQDIRALLEDLEEVMDQHEQAHGPH